MAGFAVKVPKSLGVEGKEEVWAVCQNAQMRAKRDRTCCNMERGNAIEHNTHK